MKIMYLALHENREFCLMNFSLINREFCPSLRRITFGLFLLILSAEKIHNSFHEVGKVFDFHKDGEIHDFHEYCKIHDFHENKRKIGEKILTS